MSNLVECVISLWGKRRSLRATRLIILVVVQLSTRLVLVPKASTMLCRLAVTTVIRAVVPSILCNRLRALCNLLLWVCSLLACRLIRASVCRCRSINMHSSVSSNMSSKLLSIIRSAIDERPVRRNVLSGRTLIRQLRLVTCSR